MFHFPQCSRQGPSTPGAPWVPRRPPRYNLVIQPISSSSTPPAPPSSAYGTSPNTFTTKRFQPQAELPEPDVAGIADSPHCWSFPTLIMLQMIWAMIHWTWAVQKANPQSSWKKSNPPRSNLLQGGDSPTIVCPTGGWKSGWQGLCRKCIVGLSRSRNNRNSFNMDPCLVQQWL